MAILALAFLFALLVPSSAHAFALSELITEAIAHAPEVTAAKAQAEAAKARLAAAQASLSTRWQGSANLSEDHSPTISSFQSVRTRQLAAHGALTKPIASGDTLSLSGTLTGIDQRFESPFAAQLATLNPAWRGTIDLSWRHPFGQGKNVPNWRATVARAKADWVAARAQLAITKRRLALDVLQKTVALLRAKARLTLAKDNLVRARRLQANERLRSELGLVERADRKATDALVATRELDLARAEAAWRLARVQFNRTLRRAPDTPVSDLSAKAVLAPSRLPDRLEAALSLAWQRRPEVQMLQARIEAASTLLTIARENAQLKADLVLQLGTRSLDGQPAPALARTFSGAHPFVSLGMEFADALSDEDEQRIRAAEAERSAAQAELARFRDALTSELAEALARLENAKREAKAIQRRVQRERKAFAAEAQRHREGRGAFARLLQAEGSLAAAEYEAIDAELRLQQARALLAWSLAVPPFDLTPENETPAEEATR